MDLYGIQLTWIPIKYQSYLTSIVHILIILLQSAN